MGIADVPDESDLHREAIGAGAAAFGGAAAEGAALLSSMPASGIVAAIAAPMLTAAASLSFRAMTRRGRARVGSVIGAAVAFVKERQLRDDGFFTADHTGRSAADEAIEEILRIAERDPEERKLEHLGHLLGLLATETLVGRDGAGWFIRTAGELSWNQYVLLSLIPEAGGEAKLPAVRVGTGTTWDAIAIHRELIDLGYGRRELVEWGRGETATGLPTVSDDISQMRLRQPARLLTLLRIPIALPRCSAVMLTPPLSALAAWCRQGECRHA